MLLKIAPLYGKYKVLVDTDVKIKVPQHAYYQLPESVLNPGHYRLPAGTVFSISRVDENKGGSTIEISFPKSYNHKGNPWGGTRFHGYDALKDFQVEVEKL